MSSALQSGYPTIKRRHRPTLRRFVARIAYDGRPFAGFQRQPDRMTVEGCLIDALHVLGLTGGLGFASRTDAGVHAEGQIIAFKAPPSELPATLLAGLEQALPAEIRVKAVVPAPPRFHPRWSAAGKEYLYRLSTDALPLPARSTACPELPDGPLLEAVQELLGCPTLSGFTGAGAPPRTALPLTSLSIIREERLLTLRFVGPGFGRYAIRHMVACLIGQARGDLAPGNCAQVAAAPPPYRGPRAPAEGLTLERVLYPAEIDPFA